ncbi:MAG: DNA polymerase IV [Candidatus Levybacteria bacterium]|nr:DNA polymerase IV [Candidatus Levybacteria bacterium]
MIGAAPRRIILHIDFDSFFASVEQQDHPEFRGKPLGVTASNGRTAIIAASREAKRLGIPNIYRTYDALRICPTMQFTRANFTRYWDISQKFVSICKDFSPFVEVFSIDELFMDVTKTNHLFGGTKRLIEHIKQRIQEEIGEYITVSVGVAHNKLLAKLASGLKKPNGVFLIQPSHVEQVYKIAKLTDMCGIGERIKIRLHAMGIYTLLQLRRAPLEALRAEFGNVEGHFLKNLGLWLDPSDVTSYTQSPEVKSVGRNYCLPQNEYDKRIVFQNIYELSEEIGIKLRRLKKKARTVGLSLRGTHELFGRRTYGFYANTGRDIFHAALYSLHVRIPSDGYVRQIGVWVANLRDDDTLSASMFDRGIKNPGLVRTVDSLNEKYGDHTIRNAYLLYAHKLTTVPNGFMADRYERKILAEKALAELATMK